MNIFILDKNPVIAAQQQCDKHIVKMVTESAQMLSTAHRLLDGVMELRPSKSGKRMKKYWKLNDEREDVLMKNVHENHPCTKWTMQSKTNYHWHYLHYQALAQEYEYRYGKKHGAFDRDTSLAAKLNQFPQNIPDGGQTPFALAMKNNPECIVENDAVQSYRNYYIQKQDKFKMAWINREAPEWFVWTT